MYFTLRRYRKRVGIPLGLLAFFAIIVIMSNFVWSIKVTGNDRVSERQILEQLAQSGIRPGVSPYSFTANLAELELKLATPEVAWVSIERAGSRINVKISERIDDDENIDAIPLNVPCNIIAGRSGQLISAEVYRGELLVEPGSGVAAGDVVVSGKVSNYADGYNYVHADAKLIFETVEIVDFYQPHITSTTIKNGRSKSNKSVLFLGKRFGGEININKHADHVEYSEFITAPKIFGFPLPFRVLHQNYVFRDRIKITDSPSESREKLDRQIELYELNFLKDALALEKQTEFFPDNDGIGALVRYVFQVDVAVKSEICLKN